MDTLIPAFLRRQRNQRRLTLEMLSAKVGMSPQHLSEIESGKRDPRLSSIERIAEASRHEELKAVVYNFCESRAGSHAKAFLEDWRGTVMVDDYSGYKQLMGERIAEAGCWAHARRKFF